VCGVHAHIGVVLLDHLAARRGTRGAGGALARHLAGVLVALWRDGTTFQAARVGQRPTAAAAAA
jgi:hypothetical protein